MSQTAVNSYNSLVNFVTMISNRFEHAVAMAILMGHAAAAVGKPWWYFRLTVLALAAWLAQSSVHRTARVYNNSLRSFEAWSVRAMNGVLVASGLVSVFYLGRCFGSYSLRSIAYYFGFHCLVLMYPYIRLRMEIHATVRNRSLTAAVSWQIIGAFVSLGTAPWRLAAWASLRLAFARPTQQPTAAINTAATTSSAPVAAAPVAVAAVTAAPVTVAAPAAAVLTVTDAVADAPVVAPAAPAVAAATVGPVAARLSTVQTPVVSRRPLRKPVKSKKAKAVAKDKSKSSRRPVVPLEQAPAKVPSPRRSPRARKAPDRYC